MTTTRSRFITTGTLVLWALWAFSGMAGAQTSTGILNALALERLMASDMPADHAKVSAHFVALADRYTAEAAFHEQMAQSYTSNPTAKRSRDVNVHCEKLAKLNREAAGTARMLAEHHQKMAAGTAPSLPTAAEALASVAPAPTPQQLTTLAATASSAADHKALAQYYRGLQTTYTAEAKEHSRLAMYYSGTKARADAAHCERLARLSKDAAVEAGLVADLHSGMAAVPGTASLTVPLDDQPLMSSPSSTDPADHASVAASFRLMQASAWADYTEHARLANYYRMTKLVGEAVHCEREAGLARQASDHAAAAALLHADIAESNR